MNMKKMILFVVMICAILSFTGCGMDAMKEKLGIGYTEEEKAIIEEMKAEREEKMKNPKVTTYRVILYAGNSEVKFDIEVVEMKTLTDNSGVITCYFGTDGSKIAIVFNGTLHYRENLDSDKFTVYSGDFKIYPYSE
jgi:hypothetical protein